VTVEAGTVPGRVDVRVVDQGPGIPRADRERVFEPFRQLGTGHDGGLGVGLAVAKGFMDAMEGELVVEDTPGGGTTIIASLAAAE
jgi:two-component system sensor histidine kinase KdpD